MKTIFLKPLPKSIYINLMALVAILFSLEAKAQFYNGSQMEFGKNRVQYDEFLWSYYRFDKFDTYFYQGGKDIAIYTAKTAEKHIKDLEALFDYELDGKIQFIIYNKQSHFRQSNLGIAAEESYNIGGVTRIVGTKVFLFFEGDQSLLEAQIRTGIAEVMVNEMMYGGDWREIMKNSTLLVLPEWYMKGIISYAADPWNMHVENRVKDGILSGRYKKFNRITGDEAVYAGHSMWHFIAETYGHNVVSNILYMAHVSRNVESGFLFVLGASLKTLTEDWQEYYRSKYEGLEEMRKLPEENKLPVKIKKTRVYDEIKPSPDGRYVAFVSNELGQYRVHLYDKEKNKMKKILKRDHRLLRINDYSYPKIGWHPSGKMLAILIEEEAKPNFLFYSLEDKKFEKKPVFILDKVLDFDYSHDGRKMVLSAVINGQSDLYIYNIAANTQQQISSDIFDDLSPRFINDSKQIIFSSNRTDDTLRPKSAVTERIPGPKDIFIYNLDKESNILRRVTNTPYINETQPQEWDKNRVSYLGNSNRVYNRYIAEFDSVISHIDTVAHYRHFTRSVPITNYPRNILDHQTEVKSQKLSEVVFHKGKYNLYVSDLSEGLEQDFQNFEETPFPLIPHKQKTRSRAGTSTSNVRPIESEPKTKPISRDTVQESSPDTLPKVTRFQSIRVFDETTTDTSLIDINNYEFEEGIKTIKKPQIPKVDTEKTVELVAEKDEEEEEFILPNMRTYNITYYTDQVVTQLDNNFTNTSYQPFMGGGGFFNPGMTGLFKIGISDLFEDRRIVGGFRLSPNLSSNEYFLSYENLTKRLDRQTIAHRRGMMMTDGFTLFKSHTHELKHILKYPFSEVASVRGTVSLRQDRFVTLATDFQRLQIPTFYNYWGSAKLEYVFDNVLPLGVNLYRGMRWKIFGEYYRHLQAEGVNIYIAGLDFRHYTKIHRDFIWANRFAASTSVGSHKLIYFMGGVDNWLFPKFDQQTRIDFAQNYVFQSLATNMRGFPQNARNGNSFAVINSELRMPVFRYFINQPIKSDFINNFQVIGFTDVGTAWTGTHPYSEDNTLNTEIINSNPFIITLKNQKEPIVAGYGFGLRSRIWGYFIRADWAWGVEDGVVLPRIFYLSLSLDF